jgi:transcriptional regulator with XRE-family HTH domain
MTIGEYIKEYRRQSRMSQRDLAKASGLSPGYISMLENGIDRRSGELIVPSLETLKLLAKATGKDLDALLDLIDDDTVVSLKKPTISEDDELDARIMGLVRRLPREQKLSLVDLLSVTVQGVKKK